MYDELYAKLEMPFIYGPITDEEFNLIPVPHRMTFLNGDRYIGVKDRLEMFDSKRIQSF
jgi:hypothetical protein